MILLLLLLICLLFLPFPSFKSINESDYMVKKSTLPIKGFFVLLVFFSHYKNYVNLADNFLDSTFGTCIDFLGQLVVVMFFFYSGFGIYCSYIKNDEYVKKFLLKRLFPVWLSFAICIVFFILENAALGIKYSVMDIVLSFTGFVSIGNSNWFMFVTFCLYLSFWLSFRFIKKENEKFGLIIFTLICVIMVGILVLFKEPWWYNTLLCFPFGMWFAKYKSNIDIFMQKSTKHYLVVLLLSFLLTTICFILSRFHGIFFCVYSVAFAAFVTVVSVKVRFKSVILSFFGNHVFSIYILQRLVFEPLKLVDLNRYLFFFISLIGTIVLSVIFDFAFNKLKNFLLSRMEAICQ